LPVVKAWEGCGLVLERCKPDMVSVNGDSREGKGVLMGLMSTTAIKGQYKVVCAPHKQQSIVSVWRVLLVKECL
jgi:hypothetical protein